MKKFNSQPPPSPTRNEFKAPTNGSEIKYVRTQSYPSTSRNLVEQVATVATPSQISDKEYLSHIKREYKGGGTMGRKPSMRDRSLKRQPSLSAASEKKTRWLLTRKTWRYMADAGRKLIPEGVQNKPENIEKLEEHFQKLCQNEKKFLIWKRKLSYPGASGSFRRKNKNKLGKRPTTFGSPPTGSSADECEDDRPRGKGTDDLIIKMLEKYLSINSDIEETEQSESEQLKIASSASTSRAREVNINNNNNSSSRSNIYSNSSNEPSTSGTSRFSQRAAGERSNYSNRSYSGGFAAAAAGGSTRGGGEGASGTSSSSAYYASGSGGYGGYSRSRHGGGGSGSVSPTFSVAVGGTEPYDVTKSNVQDHSIWFPVPGNESIHSSLLVDTLKQYRKKNYSPYLETDEISTDLLKDKVLLRKILNDIRTQQKYSKTIPRTESTRSLNISYSSSMSSLTSTISSTFHNFVDFIDTKTSNCRNTIRGFGEGSGGSRDMRHRSGVEFNMTPQTTSAFAVTSSSSSRSSYNSPSMLSKPHQIYSQQKQIFANQQQQQLYQQQQQYPSLRSTRTVSTTLKTITKTTSTTTVSTSKQSPDSSSPASPTSPPGILKNVSRKQLKTYRAGEVQTDGIPLSELNTLFVEYKKQMEIERQEEEDSQPDGGKGSRKPSIDNKDVSQSVSDTIKRYLMMARKKPKDNDAANRFKRVNYDRNLRNIKAKGEITKPGDDDGLMKGCQTDRDWLDVLFGDSEELSRLYTSPIFQPIVSYPETKSPLSISPPPSSPSSPTSPPPTGIISQSTQFLSNLFNHSTNSQSNSPTPSNSSTSTVIASNSGAMQKSKSSSNVGHLMSKKIFRSRSKSQTRTQANLTLVPSTSNVKPQWTPQGNGVWVTNNGKRVQLRDVFLPSLTEVERVVLEKQAQEKILQLGVTLQPREAQTAQKPHKRRVLLLKRKAVTTGIFDSKGKDDYSNKGGLVFSLPIETCIENDHNKSKEKKETRSSRSSLSSLLDHQHRDNSGSCESLPAKADAEYLHNTFLPLFHTNIDRRSSHDDDELQSSNIPGVHSQLQQVPSIVLACTKYLEENGLNTVGIFRVSTSKKRVRQLREDFDKGVVTTIDPDVCPHDIATLLKEFFRDLPEPLLCRHLYKAFLQTQSIRNRRLQLEGISHMIHLLPVAHRDTLYVLLKFLGKVARAANDTKTFDGQVLSNGNKMDSTNLATIIAPNILHCIKSDQFEEQEMAERADVINIIRIMIDHYEDLFIVSSEDMNEIYTTMMDVYPQQLDYLLERLYIRQEEDIDSGSSIPPLSPPYNQQHHHAIFSDDEKAYSPTSSSATTTISTIEMPKKVVYSREDILHENAAKGGVHSARRIKEREMRARMKYQDPEKPMRRRRQSDRTESGDLSSSSSTHESYQHSSGISVGGDRDYYIRTISSTDANKTRSSSIDSNASDVFESMTRRMSSPLQSSHGAGVVTGSLKIPVQSSGISSASGVHGQNMHFYLHEKSGHNIGDNMTDIPFIEDSGSAFEFPDEIIRKNVQSTIFPQRPQSVTVTTKRLDEVQTVNKLDDTRHSIKTSASTKDMTPSTSTKIPLKKAQIEAARKSSVTKIQMSSSVGHISPTSNSSSAVKAVKESTNYTPSISSIGSNVLRSKTADFERILSDQNKKSRISATGLNLPALQTTHNVQSLQAKIQPPPQSPTVTNINISLKTTATKKKQPANVGEETEKRMPIYKRQEIISSVQKSVKK